MFATSTARVARFTVKIAEHILVAEAGHEPECLLLSPDEAHLRFSSVSDFEDADVRLRFLLGEGPVTDGAPLLFDSGTTWKLYRIDDTYAIPIRSAQSGSKPLLTAVLDDGFATGRVFVHPTSAEASTNPAAPTAPQKVDPFRYPLGEIVMLSFLSRHRRGVILHACGVVDEGRGFLFCGVSGAGKSTMANIWKPTYATLLSDDRIIVRRMDGVFRMYGTPWHGDANVCDPGNAPLEKVFFIVHADRNYAKPISPIDAASRLLVRCFPPFWDKEGMEFVTNFLAEMAEEVPCYELGFVPDQSVVEFVRSIE